MDFAFSFSFVEKPILEGRILESDSKFEFWDDFVARSSVLVRFFGDRDRDLTIVKDSGFLIHVWILFRSVLFICVLFLFYSMEIKTLTVRNHKRVGGRGGGSAKNNAVCYFWKEGKCNRNPCRFLHTDFPALSVYHRNFKQSQASKDQLKKSLKYALGENTRGGSLEDKSNKSSPGFGEDLPRNCPLYSAKNWSVLKTGSHGLEGVNNQESSCPGAEDLQRKCPDHNNVLVLSAGGGGSEDRIAQNCNVSATEAEGLKRITVQKYIEDSPKDTVISTTEGSVPEVETPRKDQQKACEKWMSDSCVEGKGCQYLHSWFQGAGFSMLAKLSGHSEVIVVITCLLSGCYSV